MDLIDRKILDLLQRDATLSIAEIADRVGLSQTPCWKRIQRLEAQGVIERRVALLNPEKLGLGLTVFVSVETNDHSQAWLARFAELVTAMPEVLEFYRMAGDVDYMLRVVVPDMAAYDALLQAPDRGDPAEERQLALRHGAREVDDRPADRDGDSRASIERSVTDIRTPDRCFEPFASDKPCRCKSDLTLASSSAEPHRLA